MPGTFTYTPAAGTVLKAGTGQTLSVSFTPTDTTDYTTAVRLGDDQRRQVHAHDHVGQTGGHHLRDRTVEHPARRLGQRGGDVHLHPGRGHFPECRHRPDALGDLHAPRFGRLLQATATTTITVDKATPTLKLSDPGGVYDGSPFPASVTIAGSGEGNSPATSLEGVHPTLTYYDGSGTSGTNLGATPPTAAGIYTVVANFAGTADYAAVQSAPVTFTIRAGTATIALASSTGSTVYGQPITFVATVAAAGTPSGTVTFLDGGTTLATVPLDGSGTATLTTSGLALGSHSITATYSGDAGVVGARSPDRPPSRSARPAPRSFWYRIRS